MALANFFDKAAMAAAQVLQGFDRDALAAALESRAVGIAFDGAAARSLEGCRTIELAVNLMARLYPRLAIVPQGPRTGKRATDLATAARAINPAIEVVHDLAGVSACWLFPA